MINIEKLKNNNYKERDTEETSEYIKGVLEGLGFELHEHLVESGAGPYSYRVFMYLDGVKVGFGFGKGNNPEYARASALAELIERLQCDPGRVFSQFHSMYNKDLLGLHDFVVYPDEKKEYDLDKYLATDEYIKYLKGFNPGDDSVKRDIETTVRTVHKSYGYIPLAKFNEALTGKTKYIDEILIKNKLLGSTGYCAGNSKYEALLQGISEVIERYVKHVAVVNRSCFPKIPSEDLLEMSPYAYDVCQAINATGRYYVEVRDASMGGKFPAVVSILYDRAKRGYVVSFGVFPVFKSAVDRTLNEMLQGTFIKDVATITQLLAYEVGQELDREIPHPAYDVTFADYYDFTRIMGSNNDNRSIFPDEFISDNYSFEYVKWGENTDRTNEEMFYVLCEKFEEETGDTVLYKDYTFLGLPSFSIICPLFCADKTYSINGQYSNNVYDREMLEEVLYGYDVLDKEKLLEVYEEEFCYSNLDNMLGRATKCEKLTEVFFKGYIEFVKGNYTKSATLFRQNLPEPHKESTPDERLYHLDVWNVLISYIGMLDTIKNRQDIVGTLYKVYNPYIVDSIADACSDYNTLANALFKDCSNELCVVDWDKHYATVKTFKILQDAKREYFKGGISC